MNRHCMSLVAACVAALLTLSPALGQLQGMTALSYDWRSQTVSRSAARALGMTTRFTVSEGEFFEQMRAAAWHLVILDLPGQDVADKATMLSLFEQHLSRGGRLMVNYPELDRWPELQALLGVETVRERSVPEGVYAPQPGNPIWAFNDNIGRDDDLWADNGDDLLPKQRGFPAAHFAHAAGPVATVVRHDRRALTNGFDWDSMESGGGLYLARLEIRYLLECRPDLERDGSLDVFDFLRFQNLWVQQAGLANRNFDGSFDILDFLEFQNEFATGCD